MSTPALSINLPLYADFKEIKSKPKIPNTPLDEEMGKLAKGLLSKQTELIVVSQIIAVPISGTIDFDELRQEKTASDSMEASTSIPQQSIEKEHSFYNSISKKNVVISSEQMTKIKRAEEKVRSGALPFFVEKFEIESFKRPIYVTKYPDGSLQTVISLNKKIDEIIGSGSTKTYKYGLDIYTGKKVATSGVLNKKQHREMTRQEIAFQNKYYAAAPDLFFSIRYVEYISPKHDVDAQQNPNKVRVITDWANKGSLLKFLIEEKAISSEVKKTFTYDLARAYEVIHSFDEVHGDGKLENILVTYDEITGKFHVKLSDFGFTSVKGTPNCGFSPAYTAPERKEVFRGQRVKSHPAEDMWSLGLSLYELYLSQRSVLHVKLIETSYRMLDELGKQGQRKLAEWHAYLNLDNPALEDWQKMILKMLLTPNPDDRLTAEEVRIFMELNEKGINLQDAYYFVAFKRQLDSKKYQNAYVEYRILFSEMSKKEFSGTEIQIRLNFVRKEIPIKDIQFILEKRRMAASETERNIISEMSKKEMLKGEVEEIIRLMRQGYLSEEIMTFIRMRNPGISEVDAREFILESRKLKMIQKIISPEEIKIFMGMIFKAINVSEISFFINLRRQIDSIEDKSRDIDLIALLSEMEKKETPERDISTAIHMLREGVNAKDIQFILQKRRMANSEIEENIFFEINKKNISKRGIQEVVHLMRLTCSPEEIMTYMRMRGERISENDATEFINESRSFKIVQKILSEEEFKFFIEMHRKGVDVKSIAFFIDFRRKAVSEMDKNILSEISKKETLPEHIHAIISLVKQKCFPEEIITYIRMRREGISANDVTEFINESLNQKIVQKILSEEEIEFFIEMRQKGVDVESITFFIEFGRKVVSEMDEKILSEIKKRETLPEHIRVIISLVKQKCFPEEIITYIRMRRAGISANDATEFINKSIELSMPPTVISLEEIQLFVTIKSRPAIEVENSQLASVEAIAKAIFQMRSQKNNRFLKA